MRKITSITSSIHTVHNIIKLNHYNTTLNFIMNIFCVLHIALSSRSK